MVKINKIFMTALVSLAVGVSIVQPDIKPYIPSNMYKGQIGLEPDYKSMNKYYNNVKIVKGQECSFEPIELNTNQGNAYVYASTINNTWFYTYKSLTSEMVKEKVSQIKDKTEFTDYFDNNHEPIYLLAIRDCYIDKQSQYTVNAYPETESIVPGVYISYMFKIEDSEYKLTYEGLERWWCCLGKDSPDYIDNGHAYYKHSKELDENVSVPQNNILGIAGKSASTGENSDKIMVRVKLEKLVNGTYTPAKFVELYPLTENENLIESEQSTVSTQETETQQELESTTE